MVVVVVVEFGARVMIMVMIEVERVAEELLFPISMVAADGDTCFDVERLAAGSLLNFN